MDIEIISAGNLKSLTELVLELWTDCSFDVEFDNYTNIIGSENEICYLIKDHEKYIAFVHLRIRNDYVGGANDLPVAYIEGLYVKTDYQKQGIAKKLIRVAEGWAKQKGLKQIASDTDITNLASINFHKKIGFEEVERIVCFIKDL
jgi:aminoglycoside 6'-N-acetyltransferase I